MKFLVLNALHLWPGALTQSIWEVGKQVGTVRELRGIDLNPGDFYHSLHKEPFIVRSYQPTLDAIAENMGLESDSLAWLEAEIGERARINVLEGELQETRLAPVLHYVKWKYFFEKFREIDIYAVTQAPPNIRRYLHLFPLFNSASTSYRMLPPHVWASGGLKASKSAVHADAHHNQHCVLKGSKRFMLISPEENLSSAEFGWVFVEKPDGSRESGFEDAYGEYAGKLNVSAVDLEAFPGWADVPWYLAELNEGDCLYMPKNWYHYVESEPQPTVSWHVWFHLTDEWMEESFLLPNVKLSPDRCFFKEDKQKGRGQDQDWGNSPGRTSLCQW